MDDGCLLEIMGTAGSVGKMLKDKGICDPPVCLFHGKGTCRMGLKCKFLHDKPGYAPSAPIGPPTGPPPGATPGPAWGSQPEPGPSTAVAPKNIPMGTPLSQLGQPLPGVQASMGTQMVPPMGMPMMQMPMMPGCMPQMPLGMPGMPGMGQVMGQMPGMPAGMAGMPMAASMMPQPPSKRLRSSAHLPNSIPCWLLDEGEVAPSKYFPEWNIPSPLPPGRPGQAQMMPFCA